MFIEHFIQFVHPHWAVQLPAGLNYRVAVDSLASLNLLARSASLLCEIIDYKPSWPWHTMRSFSTCVIMFESLVTLWCF